MSFFSIESYLSDLTPAVEDCALLNFIWKLRSVIGET